MVTNPSAICNKFYDAEYLLCHEIKTIDAILTNYIFHSTHYVFDCLASQPVANRGVQLQAKHFRQILLMPLSSTGMVIL